MRLPALDPGRRIFTVSEVTQDIKDTLEGRFAGLWVEGEISNLRVHSSGHAYFTLKDQGAQLRAVVFRSRARRIRFEPADGLAVLAFGHLDVYAVRGEYQLVCELLEPRGLGSLQLAFEQLKARLQVEGLFDAERKRALPLLPRRIGLITSPTGAAVRDFLRVLTRRFAGTEVLIYPVRVQGELAPAEIAQALGDLNRMGDLDVLVLARGGGSLEDLWAFNEEIVARAIAASKIPVISAVGHETDVTIADFVADLRAPTPSAAAELVVQERVQLVARVEGLGERLGHAMRMRTARIGDRLRDLGARRVLSDPTRALHDAFRQVDDLGARLQRAMVRRAQDAGSRLRRVSSALRPELLRGQVRHGRGLLRERNRRLDQGMRAILGRDRQALRAVAARLDSLSPLACLARGYSICLLPSGEVVSRAAQVTLGAPVTVRLGEGTLACRVEGVETAPSAHAASGGRGGLGG